MKNEQKMNAWYVIYTHAKGEVKALSHLRRQGFDAYLPRYRKQRRHARRVDQVETPLFPRYLFVNLDIGRTPWRAINSTVGVINLVGHGGKPTPMPAGIIEAIRANENEAGHILLNTLQQLKKGDAVQITTGAMCAHEGIFECLDDNERVVILFNLLGREVKIRLPAEAVMAAA
jgi:transcriptional antiterminator RfaH